MTQEEIRGTEFDARFHFVFLREIAAQLAELNANIRETQGLITTKDGRKYSAVIVQQVLDRVVPEL